MPGSTVNTNVNISQIYHGIKRKESNIKYECEYFFNVSWHKKGRNKTLNMNVNIFQMYLFIKISKTSNFEYECKYF